MYLMGECKDTDVYASPLLCGAAFLELEAGQLMLNHRPAQRLFHVLFVDLMSGYASRFEVGGGKEGEGVVWALPRLCQHCGGLQELPRWPGKEPGAKDWWDEEDEREDEEDEEEGGAGGGGGIRMSNNRGKTELVVEDAQDEEKEERAGREERAARACMLGRYVYSERSRSTTTSSSSRTTRSNPSSTPAPPSSRWKDVFGTRLQCETSLLSSFKQAIRAWRAVREREDAETWQVKRGSKRVAGLSAAVQEQSMRRLCRVVGCVAVVTPDTVIEHTAWHRDMARAGWREGGGGGGAAHKEAGKQQRKTEGGGGGGECQ